MSHPGVDAYLADGCGRCPRFRTPSCSVHAWQAELVALRAILLDCGLKEEVKWSAPCYTHRGGNVAILGALRDHCSLGFFKGALLADPERVLEAPGAHSQSTRRILFRRPAEVSDLEPAIRTLIGAAIALEEAGAKVPFRDPAQHPIPAELEERLHADPELRHAWEALTPGRRRGYALHIGQAKQPATRHSRISRCVPRILEGKGLQDR